MRGLFVVLRTVVLGVQFRIPRLEHYTSVHRVYQQV